MIFNIKGELNKSKKLKNDIDNLDYDLTKLAVQKVVDAKDDKTRKAWKDLLDAELVFTKEQKTKDIEDAFKLGKSYGEFVGMWKGFGCVILGGVSGILLGKIIKK